MKFLPDKESDRRNLLILASSFFMAFLGSMVDLPWKIAISTITITLVFYLAPRVGGTYPTEK